MCVYMNAYIIVKIIKKYVHKYVNNVSCFHFHSERRKDEEGVDNIAFGTFDHVYRDHSLFRKSNCVSRFSYSYHHDSGLETIVLSHIHSF